VDPLQASKNTKIRRAPVAGAAGIDPQAPPAAIALSYGLDEEQNNLLAGVVAGVLGCTSSSQRRGAGVQVLKCDGEDTRSMESVLRSGEDASVSAKHEHKLVALHSPLEVGSDEWIELLLALDEADMGDFVLAPLIGDRVKWDTYSLKDLYEKLLGDHISEHGLREELHFQSGPIQHGNGVLSVPLQVELDGAKVKCSSGYRWDASSLVVLDGVVDEALRQELLDLLTAEGWDHSRGPPPDKWEKRLVDTDGAPPSWGLKEGVMAEMAEEMPPCIEQLLARIQRLYPEATMTLMPASVFGSSVSPIVGNAPMNGEEYQWHIDADPSLLPKSPWRDYWSTYTNREPKKPLFVTLLVYLNPEWASEWHAETIFLDPPSGTGVFVSPRPGRVVLMDQDITHRISAPSIASEGLPRYSFVVKLVMHQIPGARQINLTRNEWGPVTRFGSAHAAPGALHQPASFSMQEKPPVEAVKHGSYKIQIRSAGAKGRGAFAGQKIPKGVSVGDYEGERMSEEDMESRYKDENWSSYVFEVRDGVYIDARDETRSSWHRYINHSCRPNLESVVEPQGRGRVWFRTLREIQADEELTFDYGDMYWDSPDGEVIEDMEDLLAGVTWGGGVGFGDEEDELLLGRQVRLRDWP
jgi:hypothetical protein